jgi:hypothetical protein
VGAILRVILGFGAKYWITGAVIAGGVALAAATYAGAVQWGISLRAAKVQKQINERVKAVRNKNFDVDRTTIENDSSLSQRLQEIENTWTPQKPLEQPRLPSDHPSLLWDAPKKTSSP